MKIKDSKNLKYQKFPTLQDGRATYSSPIKSILDSFDFSDVKLVFCFKNRYVATIRAKNLEGERELNLVASRLKDFIGKCYEEILNFDF